MFQRSPRAAILALLAIGVIAATGLMARSDDIDPAKTAQLVAQMVERYHISQHELDDKISKKTFKRYLEELDPLKLYFLQSDIDHLAKYRTQLDEMTLAGNTEFAHVAYDLYLKRLKQRVQLAHKLIDRDFDFTKKEGIIVDRENMDWAKSEAEIQDRWRKRIKSDVLSLLLDKWRETLNQDEDDSNADQPKTEGVDPDSGKIRGKRESSADPAASLAEIRERLHKRYHNVLAMAKQTQDIERLEMYLSALTHSYDPHSSYMSPLTLEDFRISMELQLEGIGAELRSEDGYVIVNRIVDGGAAAEDGQLKAGDKIIGVKQGGEENYTDVVEMKLTRVVQLIRGDAGTVVWLQVKTAAGAVKEYKLVRQQIELKAAAVRGEIINTGKRLEDGRNDRIGVVHIPSFYRDFEGAQAGEENFRSTARDVLKVLQNFENKGGVDALIVDLRFNGGGALTEAIRVSGLFIKDGPVVQVKGPDNDVEVLEDGSELVAYTGPMVVLTNRLSASASEIFAGAIKDYHRGIIIGDTTTHGKGTVQNVMSVPRNLLSFLSPDTHGALKLTISQFYRVNGDSTQVVGVPSDVVLPSMTDHLDLGEDSLDNALPFDKINPANYEPIAGLIPEGLISSLRQRSAARIAQSEDFTELSRDITEFLKDKEKKSVSLNMVSRKADITEALDDDSDIKEDLAEQTADDRPVFPDGYYNDEVLQITADYITSLNGPRTVGADGIRSE